MHVHLCENHHEGTTKLWDSFAQNRNRDLRKHFHCRIHGYRQTPNFKTLFGNFEVEKWNFELKLRNSKSKLQKHFLTFLETFTSGFGIFSNSMFTKQITKFWRRSEKLYEVPDCTFEVSVLSFILNFEVSNQSFEVRHTWTVLTLIPYRFMLLWGVVTYLCVLNQSFLCFPAP